VARLPDRTDLRPVIRVGPCCLFPHLRLCLSTVAKLPEIPPHTHTHTHTHQATNCSSHSGGFVSESGDVPSDSEACTECVRVRVRACARACVGVLAPAFVHAVCGCVCVGPGGHPSVPRSRPAPPVRRRRRVAGSRRLRRGVRDGLRGLLPKEAAGGGGGGGGGRPAHREDPARNLKRSVRVTMPCQRGPSQTRLGRAQGRTTGSVGGRGSTPRTPPFAGPLPR
jgi:hypothetical protein